MFKIIKIKFSPVVGNCGNTVDKGGESATGNNSDSIRITVDDPALKKHQKTCKGINKTLIKIIISTYFSIFKLINYLSFMELQIRCFSCLDIAIALFQAWKTELVELTVGDMFNRISNLKICLFTFCSARVGNLVACRVSDPDYLVRTSGNFSELIVLIIPGLPSLFAAGLLIGLVRMQTNLQT